MWLVIAPIFGLTNCNRGGIFLKELLFVNEWRLQKINQPASLGDIGSIWGILNICRHLPTEEQSRNTVGSFRANDRNRACLITAFKQHFPIADPNH